MDEIIIEGDTNTPIETHTIHDHCEHCTQHAERLILIEQQIEALTRVASELATIEEAQNVALDINQANTIEAQATAIDAMVTAETALEEATTSDPVEENPIEEEVTENGNTNDTSEQGEVSEGSTSQSTEPIVIRVEPESRAERSKSNTRFRRGK